MKTLNIDLSNCITDELKGEYQDLLQKSSKEKETLINGSGKGSEYTGWLDLPLNMGNAEWEKMIEENHRLYSKAEVFVVIGIGGSYLGARAVLEAVSNNFPSNNSDQNKKEVVYAGQNLSGKYHSDLLKYLDKKDYAVIVISKSGTTTEPAIAFRLLRNHLEKKYGHANARKRIIAITDEKKGALKKLSEQECYPTFVVPDNVGGRYSVLTPVGLLPIALGGGKIDQLMKGAADMRKLIYEENDPEKNPVLAYVAARNLMYQKGKTIEVLASFEPQLNYFSEWWKQLFGESEGKEHKGIFNASVQFTTDLHSLGQYIQDGERSLFETVLSVESFDTDLAIPSDEINLDQLNYLHGKGINFVNKMAEKGTEIAHVDGGVPNIKINIPELNEYYIGQLIFFFEFACAVSGYVLGVNPFDQPGVEDYKRNMFALLGKQGYEELAQKLKDK